MTKKLLWTEEEIILVLALYFQEDQTQLPVDHPKVQKLSNQLRSFNIYPMEEREDSFRNPNSVHIRLGGFLSLDPKYIGAGMRGSTSKLVESVWDEFSSDRDKLEKRAKEIETSMTVNRLKK